MATLNMIQAPLSVSVKTAGYTIPVGRVAKLTVNLEGTATFEINGVTALRATQNSVLGSTNLQVGNSNGFGTALGTQGFSGTASPTGSAFASATDQKTIVANLVVPAGTVINGTGAFRVIVEEYNV